ncbi:MAG: hypothetical protein IKL92_02775 [Oscillospiraceae bacterium]|nr:hypothetical protein [Oscillospiraceae bacterium]
MTVTERVAYLKGLAEGMELDATSKEGKILTAIIDVLEDMAYEISDLGDELSELEEQVDMVDEDLDTLEEIVYEDDEDEYDDCDCDCDCCCDDDEDELYEVVCPSCGDVIYLDVDMLEEGGIDCPNCGENLEFELDFEEEDEEDED